MSTDNIFKATEFAPSKKRVAEEDYSKIGLAFTKFIESAGFGNLLPLIADADNDKITLATKKHALDIIQDTVGLVLKRFAISPIDNTTEGGEFGIKMANNIDYFNIDVVTNIIASLNILRIFPVKNGIPNDAFQIAYSSITNALEYFKVGGRDVLTYEITTAVNSFVVKLFNAKGQRILLIQGGVFNGGYQDPIITFPSAYNNKPIVLTTAITSGGTNEAVGIQTKNISNTSFQVEQRVYTSGVNSSFSWLAINN
jgi:hypothetical protein